GRHRQAAETLQTALTDVTERGTAADRALAGTLRGLHTAYLDALGRMFAAVDAGDGMTVLRIDNDEVDPTFGRISDLVQQATDAHPDTAPHAPTQLHHVEGMVFATTTAGFAVGLALLAAFAAVAVGYQRTLLRQAADSKYQ